MLIAVIGLGYVGRPLAIALAKHHTVIGYDIRHAALFEHRGLVTTDDPEAISAAHIYVVCVPTPVDDRNVPDLCHVRGATAMLEDMVEPSNLVIYESTFTPGTTRAMGKILGCRVGYSPERVVPNDPEHTVENTRKIIAADDEGTRMHMRWLYGPMCPLHEVDSIEVAEAAKLYENCQRDLLIALANQMSRLCKAHGVDTISVLEAAETKWNVPRIRPGLVGGHCIAVDPYYLVEWARGTDVELSLVEAARRENDAMVHYIARETLMSLQRQGILHCEGVVVVLGESYKAGVADTRGSLVPALVKLLRREVGHVILHDPLTGATQDELPERGRADVVILAVPHEGLDMLAVELGCGGVIMDLKGVVSGDVWRP